MFKKIEIRNFRAIRELDIEDLGRVNLFLGKNNCSKTSILESIFLLTGCTNPKLILDIHTFRDLSFGGKDNLSFIFHNLDYDNTIAIKAIAGEGEYRKVEIKPVKTINSEFQQSQVDLKKASYHSSGNSPSVNELSLKAEIKARDTPKRTVKGKLKFLKENSHYEVFQPDFQDELTGVYVIPKIILPDNLQQELEKQIINKQHQELIKILKIIDPRIEDISFGSQGMVYVDVGIKQLIPLNLLGDGIRRLLSIILSISNSKNGIVLIDELENGLHHSALEQTWKAILELSKAYNVQIFITTHNIETLKSLQAVLSNDEMKEYQGDIRSYTIRNLQEKHKAYKYDFEDFEHSVLQEIEIR